MFELVSISKEAIPAALEKAKHYRLLNEPAQAESICLDILAVEEDHREAIVTLILAFSDQFDRRLVETFDRAKKLCQKLDDYESAYYLGIVFERRARSVLRRGGPGSGHMTYDWLREALDQFQKAMEHRPDDNDDVLLRWNSCVRTLQQNPQVVPEPENHFRPALE